MIKQTTLFLLILMGAIVSEAFAGETSPRGQRLEKRAERRLAEISNYFEQLPAVGTITVDSIRIDRSEHVARIFFNPNITHLPVRYPWIQTLKNEIRELLGWRYRRYNLELIARGRPLQDFIPNYYREDFLAADTTRIRKRDPETLPLVTRTSSAIPAHGLYGNHIALWHSHGLYYNAAKDRWQWQRARLFGTVEDIFPMDYVIRYITPMLENAGAQVLLPRERDFQQHEVIVDNDAENTPSQLLLKQGTTSWETVAGGFAPADTLFGSENPFNMGTHLAISSNSGASATFIPEIPEDGHYAVYFSWAYHENSIPDVSCVVNYAGGSASFTINQQMGHGTWVYLGTFFFRQGSSPVNGSLTIYTHSAHQGIITVDAARFGGGMGNIARRPADVIAEQQRSVDDRGSATPDATTPASIQTEKSWKISNRPRYMEGARYYLQYAGMPDSLVYAIHEGKNDYNDDFMSRGEWVNYLMGAPLGPASDRETKGLGIPIDLALAFHTDAGVTPGDSVIGILSIYSAQRDEGLFPDGVSRLASRDLTDMIKMQIINDIRTLHNPRWTQRAIWDRQYSEAWRPNVPAMLLELLSHQNLADMRYGLDPRFQFDASRAIYKGILRFVAHQEGREPVIQPLPPRAFAMEHVADKTIRLQWQPTTDPIEPSATPNAYIVYMRSEGEGFDQGTVVEVNELEMELPEWDTVYSFKVTAVNEGGESFPSEILSVALVPEQEKTVLIVNGFQRISGPGTFDTGDMAGLMWWDDHPVPYGHSASYTGLQYDFDRNSPWLDDDSPGWGASYADLEGTLVAGNTFDYPYLHGKSIRNAGYSFISTSRGAFEHGALQPHDFFAINLIMGKQKNTPALHDPDSLQFRVFTPAMMEKLTAFAKNGGNIFLSGAYIGTDHQQLADTIAGEFAKNLLGYTWRTNNACNSGQVEVTDTGANLFSPALQFVTQPNPIIYHTEAPDGIEAYGENSYTPYRYGSNAISAAVVHNSGHKAISLGFPFETIASQQQRDQLMKEILNFFSNRTEP